MQGKLMLAAVSLLILRGMRSGGYEAFLQGAKRGMSSSVELLPALCAMTVMLRVMDASGATALVCRVLTPLTSLMNLPAETAPMLALRPLTGSGSMTALKSIMTVCGPDSRAARTAAVLMGSSETIFYTMTVYLAAADVKKLPWALPVSLVSYLAGAWVCGLAV